MTYRQAKSNVEHAEVLLSAALGFYQEHEPNSDATDELSRVHVSVMEWRLKFV
jgi:hypothetical protein